MDNSNDDIKIVQTDVGNKDGQNKCPKCGATDISLNTKTGLLRCNFCRHEFEPEKVEGLETDINNLQGDVFGSGAQDISQGSDDMITLKCTSCGAEVVVDIKNSTQARCHWCRNVLSINQQVPNGIVPDVVLPFKTTKDQAREHIDKFVGKRKFFAHPKFRQEFTTENIMGVYFPYMVIDVNSKASFSGQGEHEIRRYTVKEGDHEKTYYDAELYDVERDFDLTINGLTLESSLDKLDTSSSNKTTNIINSIMPFDTENCVKFNSNYLSGFTSEKRDTNVEQLRPIVEEQAKDIARFAANDTLKQYDRGVRWDSENLEIKGQQWKSAYLPVWLYSYQQIKNNKSILHYVAVNARTQETMGSVPIHIPKLILVSCIIELLSIIPIVLLEDFKYKWLFLLVGIIFYFVKYSKYRNSGARHSYEVETNKEMSNLRTVDNLVTTKRKLRSSTMDGANNKSIKGNSVSRKIIKSLKEE